MAENLLEKVPPRRSTIILLLIILALVAAVSLSLYFLLPRLSLVNPPVGNELPDTSNYAEVMATKFNAASDYLNDNNPEEAVVVFDEMLAEAKDDATRNSLIIRKASAMFATGNIPLSYEAIQMLGDLLEAENVDPMFRGWAVAELLQFHFLSQHSGILEKIRAVPAFSKLKDLPLADFLLEAAKMSDVLYPTTFGKIYLATPLAMELTYAELTQAEREDLAKKIEALANESITLQGNEGWSKAPYNVMLSYHYRGIVLSAAAKGGTDPALASEQFEQAISYANERPNVSSVQRLLFYSYFYYAAHLLENGDSASAEQQLAVLINKLTTSDSPEFALFVKTAYENKESNNYALFKALTEHSSLFRSTVEEKYSLTF